MRSHEMPVSVELPQTCKYLLVKGSSHAANRLSAPQSLAILQSRLQKGLPCGVLHPSEEVPLGVASIRRRSPTRTCSSAQNSSYPWSTDGVAAGLLRAENDRPPRVLDAVPVRLATCRCRTAGCASMCLLEITRLPWPRNPGSKVRLGSRRVERRKGAISQR
jgi:hypothetical protein